MIRVSVLIPTFRRPDSFLRAARSVMAQTGIDAIEIVAIDNSPEGSALSAFQHLAQEARFPLRWAHEPRPGVAHARNAALALARGEFVAWLDDDEEASPRWLASLLAVREDTGAQSIFGPVRARAPANTANTDFYERLYARAGAPYDCVTRQSYGIGNSLQPRAMFEDTAFDTRANERGGEDDTLFASWRDAGATFAWAHQAWVIEHLGPDRTRLAHGLKRAFAYGQGPCETAWAQRNTPALIRHMCIGAGQALGYGAASAFAFAASTPQALTMLDRAARGAGKVFWFMEQRFYGEALARQPA